MVTVSSSTVSAPAWSWPTSTFDGQPCSKLNRLTSPWA